MRIAICLMSAVVLLFSANISFGEDRAGSPAGQVIQASTCAAGGSKIVADTDASDGKAVSNSQPYQPMLIADVPAGKDPLTIWIRHKGGPIQLKTISSDGKQTERDWVWATPSRWAWSRVGRYARADLAQQILLMHGPDSSPVQLDCVVLSSDPDAHPKQYKSDGARDLPSAVPDDQAAPQEIEVSVQWDHGLVPMSQMLWGVNDYEICTPASAADPVFSEHLKSISPGLIRIHFGGLTDAWTNPATRSWDFDKIKTGFDSLAAGYGNAKIMFNIPSWPSWLASPKDGVLPAENQDEFVALVGQLVDGLRDRVKRPVQYFELLNERDGDYDRAGKINELWQLHNRLYAEIKKHDPNARVGGPALTWPKPAWVDSFLAACGNNIDFVSWHNYASGEPTTPNDEVFDRSAEFGKNARYVLDQAARLVPGKKLQFFLSEYNIQWTWSPIEARHGNNIGAVFDALVLHQAAIEGLDGVAAWHAKGHAYGLIDGDNTLRPAGQLYAWGNQYMRGSMAAATVSDSQLVDAWAVVQPDGSHSLMLTNRSDHTLTLRLGKPLMDTASATVLRLDSKGVAEEAGSGGLLSLPGYSVTLVRAKE